MSAARRLRRARGEQGRAIPPASCALVVDADLRVRMLYPAGHRETAVVGHVRLAEECAEYARAILTGRMLLPEAREPIITESGMWRTMPGTRCEVDLNTGAIITFEGADDGRSEETSAASAADGGDDGQG